MMGKQLVITEKPSVARDIAKALGGFANEGGILENDSYVLSSARGHLLELAEPEDVPKSKPAAKRTKKKAETQASSGKEKQVRKPGKWNLASLPTVPEKFELRPLKDSEDRLKEIRKLLKRDDIDGIVNACDAGREGELIFHNIVCHLKESRPVKRLWLQSMTPKAITEGFSRLRDNKEMIPLQRAAASRHESDWLVGVNSTRALTAINSLAGTFNLTTVGRVQTPTLAMLVSREREISVFKPTTYWEVSAEFSVESGLYRGRWIDPDHKAGDAVKKASWIMDETQAHSIADLCRGKTGIAMEEKKGQRQLPPLLFDLTSLQRMANLRFGFSAKSTLSIAQSLYDSQAITYPRTDSRRLPEDYPETVRETLVRLAKGSPQNIARFIDEALQKNYVKPDNRRVFDNSKVSDHFAIIPTGEALSTSREQNVKIYNLIATHFVATFFPPAQLEVTVRRTLVAGQTFETRGRVVVDPGWMAVTGGGREAAAAEKEEKESESGKELVPVRQDEQVRNESVDAERQETKPPRHYTEATLLSAMEGAGKFVEDEELRESLKERGLGTPATRASVIEGLLREKYVMRDQGELTPTEKAFTLMKLLEALKIDVLTKPELTGEWERKLKLIEDSGYEAEKFMSEIKKLTEQIVAATKKFDSAEAENTESEPTGVVCPMCGKGRMHSGFMGFRCSDCSHTIKKSWSGHELSVSELAELVDKGRIGPFDDFRSARTRRGFSAELVLNDRKFPEFDFGSDELKIEDMDGRSRIGACPSCQKGQVIDAPMAYVCEHGIGASPVCKFKIGKKILQHELTVDEVQSLMRDRVTAKLTGFVSKRTRRPFSAKLKLEDKEGTLALGFEFESSGTKKGKPANSKARKS